MFEVEDKRSYPFALDFNLLGKRICGISLAAALMSILKPNPNLGSSLHLNHKYRNVRSVASIKTCLTVAHVTHTTQADTLLLGRPSNILLASSCSRRAATSAVILMSACSTLFLHLRFLTPRSRLFISPDRIIRSSFSSSSVSPLLASSNSSPSISSSSASLTGRSSLRPLESFSPWFDCPGPRLA